MNNERGFLSAMIGWDKGVSIQSNRKTNHDSALNSCE